MVIVAVAAAAKLDIQELWVAFGTVKKFRYIPVHDISLHLLVQTSPRLLPVLDVTPFHLSTHEGRRQLGTFGKFLKK